MNAFSQGADDFKGEIVNVTDLGEGLVGGGLISKKAIEIAKQKGYKTVIDFRLPTEGIAAEKKIVEENGLLYINIPTYRGGRQEAEELRKILSVDGIKPAILHCRSGSRLRAVWAAYQRLEN